MRIVRRQSRTAPDAGAVVGVGTDLVEVDRLRAALQRQPGLSKRLFTGGEVAYAELHRDPLPHLAARFAAKESVMKALGKGLDSIPFSDIEVVRAESGIPSVKLHGRATEIAGAANVAVWHLSLTHTSSLAHATVVAERRRQEK